MVKYDVGTLEAMASNNYVFKNRLNNCDSTGLIVLARGPNRGSTGYVGYGRRLLSTKVPFFELDSNGEVRAGTVPST